MKQKTKPILFWFILLQPFLDLYWFYNGNLTNIFPFTLPTIIRILAVAVLIGLFFSQKKAWKRLSKEKWLLGYLALLIIYSALHLLYARNFTSVNPSNYNYSTVSELFYLIRMALPLIIIYLTNELTFSQKEFRQVIEGISALFSGTIVLANLFVISLKSYETGFINANIFAWFFNPNIGYSHMASKGFFNSANMTSAVLFMLMPLMIYYLFTSFNWKTIVLNVVQALAMIELGTKVAAIGLLGGIVIGLGIYLIHRYLIKDIPKGGRAFLTAVLIGLASCAILPFGPAIQRYNYEIYLAKESDHDLSQEKRELAVGLKKYPQGKQRTEFLRDFIKENYPAYAINPKFILKSYPYQYDPEFWLKIMNEPGQERMKNRNIEKAMLDQVRKTNNNKLDKFLGISYTRENNIFNLERDFSSQIYSLGWCGMLLFVGPYVGILLYAITAWLRKKRVRTYLISSMITATACMLFAAFSSGNVLDFLTASFILAFVEGNLLVQIKKQTE
ncbi:O-antigen ligase family protein [Lactobacillus sp. ESL0791]|uniref:O-antigen ligase family protein n=1 Tax=Lactobacillus sp. ESL0791 TaxID=2983234 RepID=UPI0023F7BA0C|nr:O-antigen ligase family protein [Lactobacillus sp. ESL0791]MDF7639586.1 O-antigen ligase family protein [Lactobacillus sp. ESL0791]